MVNVKKTSFWLPLLVLLCVLPLFFTGFSQTTKAANNATEIPYDPFGLGFEDHCYDCHNSKLEDVAYYCHELIATRSYISRVYLKAHYIWIVLTLDVPAAIYMPPDTSPTQTEFAVNIFGRAFIPTLIHIPVGTTITWTNLDTEVHNVTSATILGTDILPFSSGSLEPGASYSHTFNEAGTFYYYREFLSPTEIPREISIYGTDNPGMMGMVIVGEPGSQDIVTEITEDIALPWEEWDWQHD